MEMTISGLREKLGEANDEQLRELICQLYKHATGRVTERG